MSVWYSESFKGELLWSLSKTGVRKRGEWEDLVRKADINFTGGTLLATGDYPEVHYPEGTPSEILDGEGREEFIRIFRDTYACRRAMARRGHVLSEIGKKARVIYTGLPAVYHLYHRIVTDRSFDFDSECTAAMSLIRVYMDHMLSAQHRTMRTTKGVSKAIFSRINWQAASRGARMISLCERVRQLITLQWHGKCLKASYGRLKPYNLAHYAKLQWDDEWEIYCDSWVTALRTPDMATDEWMFLTSVDIDRLQQMLRSRGLAYLDAAFWCTTAGNDRGLYLRLLRRALSYVDIATERCDDLNAHNVCKAFKAAFAVYTAHVAGDLSLKYRRDYVAGVQDLVSRDVFDWSGYVSWLKNVPVDIAQNVGRIFKIFPAPDGDIGTSFTTRQRVHLDVREVIPIKGDNPCSAEEFALYFRKLLIITLMDFNAHRGVGRPIQAVPPVWWDAYIQHGTVPAGLDWVNEVDLRGTRKYLRRTGDLAFYIKDSVVCEENLEEASSDKSALDIKRNMILRYLFDDDCPTISSARAHLSSDEHVHRVGFKMEGHKPVMRNFYIGNYSDRLCTSESDENIHRTAVRARGYIVGVSPEKTVEKIQNMISPDLPLGDMIYYLNYDFREFSPTLLALLRNVSTRGWDEVLDDSMVRKARRATRNATLILNKRGYKGAYTADDLDLEGYKGKENTFLAIALMGYGVYRYNRQAAHPTTIDLAAYIDDGLAVFHDKIANGAENFERFVEIVDETFTALGMRLNLPKSYPSDRFATMLNEVYIQGRHVPYGLRAVLRAGSKIPEPTDTLDERVALIFSSCQGAEKAGLDQIAAFCLFHFLLAWELLRFGIRDTMCPRAMVLFVLAPIALGGLSTGSWTALTGNLVRDSFVHYTGLLQECVRTYPPYHNAVVRLLRQAVVLKSRKQVLMAPLSVRTPTLVRRQDRLRSAVMDRLRKATLSRGAFKFFAFVNKVDLQAYAEAVLPTAGSVAHSYLLDVRDANPFSMYLNFMRRFESSRTVTALLGRNEMRRIAYLNRQDAFKSFRDFRSLSL